MKHSNISIFVPHNGCPHQCSFCNQKKITGQSYQPTEADVVSAIETAIKSGVDTKNTEIAFFGGSFTAIERSYMVKLLEATKPYIDSFYGIRCSTRPDAVNQEVLDILKAYKVRSIELGAQSMCDDVLKMNNRGHNASDVIKASELIKENNISLGLQMMTGLYGSTPEKDILTAEKIADLAPDTVRIYPTLTLKDTTLADYKNQGLYIPYDKNCTIDCCSKVLEIFYKRKINVIRVGLHYSEDLIGSIVGGYYHPAFRELCESRIFYNTLVKDMIKLPKGKYDIYVGSRFISKAIGNKKENINKLKELGFSVKFLTADLEDYKYIIEEKK